jgi:hypothetical protein
MGVPGTRGTMRVDPASPSQAGTGPDPVTVPSPAHRASVEHAMARHRDPGDEASGTHAATESDASAATSVTYRRIRVSDLLGPFGLQCRL